MRRDQSRIQVDPNEVARIAAAGARLQSDEERARLWRWERERFARALLARGLSPAAVRAWVLRLHHAVLVEAGLRSAVADIEDAVAADDAAWRILRDLDARARHAR